MEGERAEDALSARGRLDRAARAAGDAAPVLQREETDHADVSASGRPLSAGRSTFEDATTRVEADSKYRHMMLMRIVVVE